MDFLLAIIIFILSLIYSISKQISTFFPVLIGMFAFSFVAFYRGYKVKNILEMLLKGIKKSLSLIPVFTLIGMITALWRASGTIPFFVYYGTKILKPEYFILFSFLLTCFVSFALGTSFGTVGTIGIVLMVLAKSGNVDIYVTAGAIISGAFFGDRSSPVSSSANLVAIVTETDLYDNVKKMVFTGTLPFLASIGVYFFLSKANPINVTNNELIEKFNLCFNLNISVILPACIIFLLVALKMNVKISMFFSLLTSIGVSMFVQKMSFREIIKCMIFGYVNNDRDLSGIISGGGLITMVSVLFVVLIASSYSGLFEGTGMLKDIRKILYEMSKKTGIYLTTLFTSLVTCALCCNQTLPILLTKDLMGDIYKKNGLSKSHLAIDMENTVVLIAEIFPWSITIGVPLATIGVGPKAIPYAVYLFLVPLLAPLGQKFLN